MRQLVLWHRAAPQPTATATADGAADYPGTDDESALARWFSAALGRPVLLAFTVNRSTMVSFRAGAMGVSLRLHRIFCGADVALMRAVLAYVRGDRQAARRLDHYIAAHAGEVGPLPGPAVRPRGDVHDLGAIFAELNAAYFHGACTAQVTWGPPMRPRGRQSLRLGVYLPMVRLISLHACLDQAFVPRFYVAWVVFHEMLHELFGIAGSGRRRLHPPEFAAVESSHPDCARARAWERDHLARLLAYRPPPGPPRGARRRRPPAGLHA